MQILFEPSNKPSYEYPNQYFHFRISWKNHAQYRYGRVPHHANLMIQVQDEARSIRSLQEEVPKLKGQLTEHIQQTAKATKEIL